MIRKKGKHGFTRAFAIGKCSGFTLVELTVSIAVIAVILVMVVLGLNRVKGEGELDMGVAEFAVQLKIAQNYADTYQINDQVGGAPDKGYGIHYDYPGGTSYFMFANLDDEQEVFGWDETSDIMIGEFSLPTGVEFTDCQYHSSPASGPCDIVFELGDDVARVRTDDGRETDPEHFKFVMQNMQSGDEGSVIIKRWAGLIYEE